MNVDRLLNQRVEDQLDWEPNIDPAEIGGAVESGIVTLTGHVPTFAQRVAVEEAGRRIREVRGVAQHKDVRPPVVLDRDQEEPEPSPSRRLRMPVIDLPKPKPLPPLRGIINKVAPYSLREG